MTSGLGFIAVSSKMEQALKKQNYKFLRLFESPVDEEDLKLRPLPEAHYFCEYHRLRDLMDECSLGSESDLEEKVLTQNDFLTLTKEMEIAMNYYQNFISK